MLNGEVCAMRIARSLVVLFLGLLLVTSCGALGRQFSRNDPFEIGLALFNQGRFAAAVPHLEDATHDYPNDARAYLYLGRAYLSQSKCRQAIPPLRTAFRLSPRDAQDEIVNLIIDAGFAAALNDFRLGDVLDPPRRSRDLL
jgi:cytochrome c-type biogenesis protein CcmH/NrfG